MSDNLDVVPEASVVDFPSEYEPGANAETETETPVAEEAQADESNSDEEPVSLDPEPETEEDTENDADEDPEPGEAEAAGETEADLLEFDFGGNKLEIPKGEIPQELAEKMDSFSREIWSDYTKKSQANAETAKMLSAREVSLDKIQTLTDQTLNVFAQGKTLKSEIEQLSTIDMQSLWQSDPDQARMVSDTLSAKQAELQNIITDVDQYEHELTQARQSEIARRSEEGKQVLDRKYKGFSTETAPKLEAYAISQGVPEADARSWAANPVVAEMAYKAMLYDGMQNAAKAPKLAPKKATPVRSMRNKGGNRQAANPNDMSFSELGKVLGIK